MGSPQAVAEWTLEERDVAAEVNARSGSTLDLVRWPLAFFVAYLGAALSDRDGAMGPAFGVGSGLAIVTLWLLASLGVRGSTARRLARASRALRLSIDGDRIRCESSNGYAQEEPLSSLTESSVGTKGILLGTRTASYFIPRRALGANEEAFKAIAAGVRPRRLPRGTWVTVGMWSFAAFVGVTAYYQ